MALACDKDTAGSPTAEPLLPPCPANSHPTERGGGSPCPGIRGSQCTGSASLLKLYPTKTVCCVVVCMSLLGFHGFSKRPMTQRRSELRSRTQRASGLPGPTQATSTCYGWSRIGWVGVGRKEGMSVPSVDKTDLANISES